MADQSASERSSGVSFRDMYLALETLRREMAEAADKHSERVLEEIRRIVDSKQEEHERLESRIDAERVARERAVQDERAAREKAVQEERDARLALQTKIVTFISLATGIVSALMFLLNLFAPLLRDLLNLPSP